MYYPKFSVFVIYIAVFLLCSLKQTNSEVQYIIRNSTDVCSMQPCLTLSQFAANSSHYHLHSNTTLIFLPGTHYLNVKLEISNQNSFMMNSEHTTAQIVCTDRSHNFYFRQLQYVHITDLEFVGCRGNRVENVNKFVVSIASFRGLGISERSSQRQLIRNSALILVQTRAQIINSTFVSNKGGSVRENTRLHFQGTIPGSVSAFITDNVGGAIFAAHCEIEIIQSVFESNGADFHY